MKKRIFCAIAAVLTAASVWSDTETAFAADGIKVVCPDDAGPDTKFAAWDLKNHLVKITGGTSDIEFQVGTEAAKAKALAAAGTLANGESAAVSDGRTVWIWGEGQRGTANGVYVYLEDRLGCRWLTPWDEPVIPVLGKLPDTSFADVNRPRLTERWILTHLEVAQNHRNGALFAYRNRLNTDLWKNYNNIDLPEGVKALPTEVWCPPPMVHSIFVWMPPHDRGETKGSFAEHPDWFSMDKDGKRTDKLMVCFSNRGLRDELTRRLMAAIDRNGGKGCYDLSQRDECGESFCYCPECRELERKYGTVGAPLLDFLKELGTKLERERPGASLHFLAYRKGQTQVPPNREFGRLPDNVIPVFAPIDDDFSKDYTHPNNAGTFADLKRWGEITRHLWTWYYPLPYGHGCPPFLAIGRWSKDLRLAADAGLTGGSFEHDVGYASGWNFADLQAWLITKLYEHPEKPVGRLVSEFCRLYYGAAADELLGYIRELESITREHPASLAWNSAIFSSQDAAHLTRWNALFDRAEAKVASDPVLLQRLRECRMGVDHAILKRYARLKKAGFGLPPDGFYTRLTNTLERAYARRCPGKEENASAKAHRLNPARKGYEQGLKIAGTAYSMAKFAGAKLPAIFDGIPEEDLIEVPNMGGSGGAQLVDMADAAYGRANSDEGDSNDPKGFLCGFWDATNKRFGESRRIQPEDVKEPDRFAFYRIGVISPSPSCYVFPGGSCRVRSSLNECYSPGEPEYWEIWLSLKFEGPRFKGSKAKKNLVWYDRAVLVRVKK